MELEVTLQRSKQNEVKVLKWFKDKSEQLKKARHFKVLLVLTPLVKFLAKYKTLVSMLIALAAYATMFTWKLALAMIYLIFVHELGHMLAARRKGIPFHPAVFIPFLGAVVVLKKFPKDAETSAYISIAGPLFGLISTVPPLLLYMWTEKPFWLVVVYACAFINLINLLPMHPFDGGKVAAVFSKNLWIVGVIGLTLFQLIKGWHPYLIILTILGLSEVYAENLKHRDAIVARHAAIRAKECIEILKGLGTDDGFWKARRYITNLKIETADFNKDEYPLFGSKNKKIEHEKLRIDQECVGILEECLNADEKYIADTIQHLETKKAKYEEMAEEVEQYYNISKKAKWTYLILYLTLVAILGILSYWSYDTVTSLIKVQK